MRFMRICAFSLAAFAAVAGGSAYAAEQRLGLVLGEAAYPTQPLATAANDAGLIAQTLQAAGFDVTGARDLDEEALKRAFRDFLDKVAAAGPDTVAFVYFSGYGVQFEGENYLVPVNATIARNVDIPLKGLRVSDYEKALEATGAKLNVIVLDAAHETPFHLSGAATLAGGLGLYEPGRNGVIAFNTAPGAVAPRAAAGAYGVYAHALAEMMRDGGQSLADVFDKTRLRVAEDTKGAQMPWNSKVATDFLFFQRLAGAPARNDADQRERRPISEQGPADGYTAALLRDTMPAYEEYLSAFPDSANAKRVRALLAGRREALTWRRARTADSPEAYWSYLQRYAHGPHAYDARRRLARLSRDQEPPESFAEFEYDVPPPPHDEIIYVDRPTLVFDDPAYGFAPPPPPAVYFLAPPPRDFEDLPPPYVIEESYALPTPVYVPVPAWVGSPAHIAPPPENLIFNNLHNGVAVDPALNAVVVKNPGGHVISSQTLGAAALGAGAAVAIGAALPHFIGKKTPPVAPASAPPPGGLGGPLPGAPGHAPAAAPAAGPHPAAPPAPAGVQTHALPGLPGGAPLAPAGVQNHAAPGTPGVTPGGAPGLLNAHPGAANPPAAPAAPNGAQNHALPATPGVAPGGGAGAPNAHPGGAAPLAPHSPQNLLEPAAPAPHPQAAPVQLPHPVQAPAPHVQAAPVQHLAPKAPPPAPHVQAAPPIPHVAPPVQHVAPPVQHIAPPPAPHISAPPPAAHPQAAPAPHPAEKKHNCPPGVAECK